MRSATVSVIIPVYNGQNYVGKALQSLFEQEHPPQEVIVVDDGSTDQTAEVLASFGDRIRVILQEHRGVSAARNAGVRVATGEFIGLLDADDWWPTQHLSKQLSLLLQDERLDFVRGQTRVMQEVDGELQDLHKQLFMDALVGACLYRRRVFAMAGGFAEDMSQGEDMDWHLRLLEHGCVEKRIDEIMLFYRKHEGSLTSSPEAIKKGQMDVLLRKIARERARLGSAYASS